MLVFPCERFPAKFPRSYWQKNPSDCCLRWYIRVIKLILKIFSYENFKVKVTQKFFPYDLSLFFERTKIKGRNIRNVAILSNISTDKKYGRPLLSYVDNNFLF